MSEVASSAMENKLTQRIVLAAAILLISCGIEVGVFNYRAIESYSFPEVAYEVDGTATSNGHFEIGSEQNVIVSCGDTDVRSVSVTVMSSEERNVKVSIEDAGSSIDYAIVDEEFSGRMDFRIHPYGLVKEILVSSDSETEFDVSVSINERVPFHIMPLRVAAISAVLVLAWLLRPSSSLHRRVVTTRYAVFVGAVFALLIVGLCMSGYSQDGERSWHHQYHELAVALSEGQADLDLKVPDELRGMDNPYDKDARSELDLNYKFFWDHAYYEGNFYVYFGVLPALIYHLPFYLLTGDEFPNWLGVCISLFGVSAGLSYLLRQVCLRWFQHCTQALYMLALLILHLGSWLVYACQYPDLYSLPISTGLACCVWGVAFWIRATRNQGVIHLGFAVAGSMCVALTLASRPQMFIGAIIGIVLIAPYLRRISKENVIKISASLFPFIVVLLLLGAYNNVRFGSPFDFGANYNITTNDMTLRGFNLDRVLPAIFGYLLQSPSLSLDFPYLNPVSMSSGYYGRTITEGMKGGIFLLTPILLILVVLVLKRFRSVARASRGVFSLIICCLAASFILVIFDANGAGILIRYFLDFGFFISFSAVLVLLVAGQENATVNSLASTGDGMENTSSLATFNLVAYLLIGMSLLMQVLWWISTV